MRSAIRFVVPLLVLLALVALGASAFMSEQAHRWAARDLTMRSQVILVGAREALAERIARKERTRIAALLEELVQDERLLGAAVCGAGELPTVSTRTYPKELRCDTVPPDGGTADGSGVFHLVGGTVHLSVLPIADHAGAIVGRLALVHDMSYVDRRASETRTATFLVFAVVGLLAAGATILASRFSWVSWSNELRRHLSSPFRAGPGPGPSPSPQRAFLPVLSDVRELVQRLTSEESSAAGGRWTPERLRSVLRSRLHGEGVVVVANREPYIHERMPDRSIRVLFPASGLVTAMEPVMRACSGTWIAHGSGSADHDTVDAHDRLRVPPGDEVYHLRR
ncbi:MAG: trehalose-6-phosphate synthase, partial [Anaeromyxobacteraceae bacterium]